MVVNEEMISVPKKYWLALEAIAEMFGQQNDLVELGAKLCEELSHYQDSLPPEIKDTVAKMIKRASECHAWATQTQVMELFD